MRTATIVTAVGLAGMAILPHCPAPMAAIPFAIGAIEASTFVATFLVEAFAGILSLLVMFKSAEVENEMAEARARCLANPECKKILETNNLRRVRRQANPFPGIPQYAWDQCNTSMKGATVTVSHPGPDAFRFEGVPATCMNLAAFFTQEGRPIPCGSACLDYVNLSDAGKATILNILQTAPMQEA